MGANGGVFANAVHARGICQSIQVMVAGLPHSRHDHRIVFVFRQFVDNIRHHSIVGRHTCQNAVSAGDIGGQHVVGDGHTVIAPFLAHNVGHQSLMAAGPYSAPAGISGHHAIGAAFFKGILEGPQIDLTGSLLVQPYRLTDSFLLTVIEGEVLDDHIHTLVLNTQNLCGTDLTGQEAVLGVILKVPSAVGGTVGIAARAVQANHICSQAVVTDDLAYFIHEFRVEGGSHHIFRGKGSGFQLRTGRAKQRCGQTLGAILVTSAGRLYGFYRHSPMEGVANEGNHFVKGQLIQKGLPFGIVER